MIKGVMFDFSGTLLRIEPVATWLDAVLDAGDVAASTAVRAECAERLHLLGAQPGGPAPVAVPPRLQSLWKTRDLTADTHREAYSALAYEALTPFGPFDARLLADALYDRSCSPEAWQPYPDAAPTLAALRACGLPVAVVSNIGWDLRPVFAHHDLTRHIDHFLLSYEFGAQKPDPRIFRAACDALALPPEAVLMVGDDRTADAGAAAIGCPVHLVDHLPATERPDALTAILALL